MTAIEFVVLTPIMFTALMLTVQFVIFMFAKEAAQAAVRDGGRVAREQAGMRGTCPDWVGLANAAVHTRATSLGGSLLDVSKPVTTASTPDPAVGDLGACRLSTVSVEYVSAIPTIIPFMAPLTVDVVSDGPVEQFVQH